VTGPTTSTARYGEIDAIDAVATLDRDEGRLALFAANRSPSDTIELVLDPGTIGPVKAGRVVTLSDPDPHAANTMTEPRRATPRETILEPGQDGLVRVMLPPVSWSAVLVSV
jgi:alpha-N-arabinofuranosidase